MLIFWADSSIQSKDPPQRPSVRFLMQRFFQAIFYVRLPAKTLNLKFSFLKLNLQKKTQEYFHLVKIIFLNITSK